MKNLSVTVEVNTPEGVLYCTICEDEHGLPVKIISTFGKAGTTLAAWAYALDATINLLLEKKTGVNEIIQILSNISHSKPLKTAHGVRVGSGPEGIVVALLEYKRQKFKQLKASFETTE